MYSHKPKGEKYNKKHEKIRNSNESIFANVQYLYIECVIYFLSLQIEWHVSENIDTDNTHSHTHTSK